jgi:hypothetical protein
MKTTIQFWLFLAHLFLEWEMFQTQIVEKIKPHTLCSTTFYENRAVHEIMRKNIVQPDRPKMAT